MSNNYLDIDVDIFCVIFCLHRILDNYLTSISAMTTSNHTRTTPIVVFHDGGCGLCSREISHYRGLQSVAPISWVDIASGDTRLLDAYGITVDEAMRRFHVLGADGVLRVGAGAFVVMWSALPYYQHLSRLVYRTRAIPLLDRIYEVFARRRYTRRRNACEIGLGQTQLPTPTNLEGGSHV
jgi:predicted DCC family thiol-disulfide oxidoreductase YuxK